MTIFNRNHLLALVAATAITGCTTVPDESAPEVGTDPTQMSGFSQVLTTGAVADDTVVGSSQTAEYGSASAAALSTTTVYFDFDKANIRPEAYEILKAHAAYLSANAGAQLRLDGHADERGTREYNLALGERRGKAAASYLAANGASRSQLEVISYGEERPVSVGNNESAWAENRRVELKYTAVAP